MHMSSVSVRPFVIRPFLRNLENMLYMVDSPALTPKARRRNRMSFPVMP